MEYPMRTDESLSRRNIALICVYQRDKEGFTLDQVRSHVVGWPGRLASL
jgi:hypothetical protein